ncbi:hypothetical protein CRV00_01545 [Malaciobacter molluscorum]|nr:tetratricopeptide repeat protein [Malaciobacter molluscorum]RXJ96330.1 hypothetical protein CRV00_01545 [Malaciobacter molluscorum]
MKIILSILLFITICFSDTFDEAITAYKKGEYKKTVRIFKKLAIKGNVSAQYNLGIIYEQAQGVKQDYKEAIKWYKLAVKQKDSAAQYNLGVLYQEGKGVK